MGRVVACVIFLLGLVAGADQFRRLQRNDSARPLALFEFAPASGRGLSTPCACVAVTGARGEAMTFSRASAGFCSKAGEIGGIQAGDLVSCGNNLPRVMPGGNGTGGNGILIESAATNQLLRSSELDNVAWLAVGSAVVTANAATGPDGTSSAEKVVVPSCAGTNHVVRQTYTGSAAAWSGSIYARALLPDAGTGLTLDDGGVATASISTYQWDSTASAGLAAACALRSDGWTRCGQTRTFANATQEFGVGCQDVASVTGHSNTGAASFLVWGAQAEAGALPTSPIATTGAAATRQLDSAYFDGAISFSTTSASIASTIALAYQGDLATLRAPLSLGGTGVYFTSEAVPGVSLRGVEWTGSATATATHSVAVPNQSRVWVAKSAASSASSFWAGHSGASTSATSEAATAFTRVSLGQTASVGRYLGGVVKRVCVDTNWQRCR